MIEDKQEALRRLIARAIEARETVPPGVYLIGTREPTPREIERGLSLQKRAAECLLRRKS